MKRQKTKRTYNHPSIPSMRRRGQGWSAANKMIALVGESPTLTIVRSGQVVISGVEGGNNLYESPEVNGQSARQEA